MHLMNPITMRVPSTFRGVMTGRDSERGNSYTDTFCLPPDTTTLIHVTRYWFVTGKKTVV